MRGWGWVWVWGRETREGGREREGLRGGQKWVLCIHLMTNMILYGLQLPLLKFTSPTYISSVAHKELSDRPILFSFSTPLSTTTTRAYTTSPTPPCPPPKTPLQAHLPPLPPSTLRIKPLLAPASASAFASPFLYTLLLHFHFHPTPPHPTFQN